MYPDDFGTSTEQMFETLFGTMVGALFVVYIIVVLIALAIAAVSYVLRSVSLYSIATRRGIKKPWLAWVPVLNCWTMGCISDQYRYVTKGQVKNKRKSLLILKIIVEVLSLCLVACNCILFFGAQRITLTVAATMAIVETVVSFVVLGVGLAAMVVSYMAMYDLYCSCEPGNAVLYLVLSIFIRWLTPVFLMIVRKKDGGMPPRKADVAQIPAQPQAETPCENPAAEQEPWSQTGTEE